MTRKAFFAAFVIDEETYTPEPGPVDRHFVVSDLAQSSFGEQPGVSNFIVWDTIANLIAEHRQQGPITADYLTDERPSARETFAHTPETCPSTHWNRGDDICADCGADLNPATSTQPESSCTVARPSFRDHLSPTMRTAQAFNITRSGPASNEIGRSLPMRTRTTLLPIWQQRKGPGRSFEPSGRSTESMPALTRRSATSYRKTQLTR